MTTKTAGRLHCLAQCRSQPTTITVPRSCGTKRRSSNSPTLRSVSCVPTGTGAMNRRMFSPLYLSLFLFLPIKLTATRSNVSAKNAVKQRSSPPVMSRHARPVEEVSHSLAAAIRSREETRLVRRRRRGYAGARPGTRIRLGAD